MVKWQPVETAPKTGEDVIVAYRDRAYPGITLGYWSESADEWTCSNTGWMLPNVTHWIPLPTHPVFQQATKETTS